MTQHRAIGNDPVIWLTKSRIRWEVTWLCFNSSNVNSTGRSLREYTRRDIKEADRLQALMDRLLTPHRPPNQVPMNIHEVCERVRSLILAEFPEGYG